MEGVYKNRQLFINDIQVAEWDRDLTKDEIAVVESGFYSSGLFLQDKPEGKKRTKEELEAIV